MDNPLPHIYNLEQLKGLKGAPRVTFPDGNLSVKQVERVLEVPIEAAWDAFLSTEGYEAEFAGTKLVFQQQLDNDHIYKRIYQRWTTLPGSELEATTVGGDWRSQFAKDGEIVTTTQPVESGIEQLADGNKVVSGQINPTDNNQSTISVSEAPGGFVPIVDLAYGADQWRRFAADGNVTITKTLVNKGTAPDTGALVISSEVIAQSDAEDLSAIKTTVSGSSLVPLTSVNALDRSALGGTSTTVETPVATGTALPSVDWKTLEATHQALNAKQALQTIRTVEEYPIIESERVDEETGIIILESKTFVDAATAQGSISGNQITEIQGYDKLKSIQIVSKIDLTRLPDPETTYSFVQKSFPAVLIDQYWIAYVGSTGFQALGKIPFHVELQSGFSASIRATKIRTFHSSEPTETEEPTIFAAQSHKVVSLLFGANGTQYHAESSIPSCLHGELSERWGQYQVGVGWLGVSGTRPVPMENTVAFMTPFDAGPIPATSPSSLVPDTEFIHDVQIEKWRFGMWAKTVWKAKIPTIPS